MFPSYWLLVPAAAWLCVTSRSCVPLSRCTFLLVDVINDPCVLFDAAEFRLRPFKPKTPWLLEVNCPAVFSPPGAPLVALVEFAVELSAPPASPPTFPAVLVAPPTLPVAFVITSAAPPDAEPTPPRTPPDERPDAPAPPTAGGPAAKSSLPTELGATDCAAASA